MRRRGAALLAAVALAAGGCVDTAATPSASRAVERSVVVTVRSERDERVEGAKLVLVGRGPIPIEGATAVAIDQPVAGVMRADGFLDEPVVLGPGDGGVTVRLLRRVGPTGTERRVLHFGGDVMLGRRYQAPGARHGSTTAVSPDDARAVVREVAPLMAAADSTMVNLETVVGDLPAGDAYQAKRYQLQSPPTVVDALREMGVDFAALGNNHAYDWQEAGIRSTTKALDAGRIAWAGAGETASGAGAGRMLTVKGTKVGVVSATTVNGDFVNDSLPRADATPPADLAKADAWQYEERSFGFGAPGDANHVVQADRRPGQAWRVFTRLEPTLSADETAALWEALTSPDAYPELQDWVARRGHGGAAPFDTTAVSRQVAKLRAAGAELVVVQIHGGFQFSEAPSDFMRRSARAAVDAGADLVVGHHPHVLQGFEWYRGKLIAYSLGNFVFDQDFLSTFPSVILRTVFEGDTLVEARVVPVTIDRYRPVPVSGDAADRVLRMLSARSAAPASSDRLKPDLVASVLDGAVATNATVERDGATGRVLELTGDRSVDTIPLGRRGEVTLPPCSLVRRPAVRGDEDVALGTDLLGWGSLEDATADGSTEPAPHWLTSGTAVERFDPERGAYLHMSSAADGRTTARQVARSTLPAHRWYRVDGQPADGAPSYTAELDVRVAVRAPELVVTLYDVNDTDPTVDPESVEIHRARVPLLGRVTLPRSGGEWQTASVDLTDLIEHEYGGVRPEALLLYVVAPGGSVTDVDDVRLLEWRPLGDVPVGAWVAADALRGTPESEVRLATRGCG